MILTDTARAGAGRTNGDRQRLARLAGLLYGMMGLTGAFTLIVLPRLLAARGAGVGSSIAANAGLYRFGILVDLSTSVFAIWMAVILCEMFQDVHRLQARLMVGFAFGMAAAGLVGTLALAAPLAAPLVVSSDAGRAARLDAVERDAFAALLWSIRLQAIRVATMYWGVWLVPLGSLVRRCGFLPRILGTLLLVAGWSYVISAIAYFVAPQLASTIATAAMLPQGVGEAGFVGWLLVRGVSVSAAAVDDATLRN